MTQANSKHPHLTKQTQKFVDDLTAENAAPLYTLSYEDARQVLLNAQSQKPLSKDLACDIEDVQLPVGPTGMVDVRIFRPKGNTQKLPILIYYHGGGWVMGDKKTHDRLVRELTIGANVMTFFVVYTPSPEAQFPIPVEQGYAALEYIHENADKFNGDANKIVTCGDSVGGNMTAVTAIMAKMRKGPKILKQILLYPVTDGQMDTPSYNLFADGPWLTKKAMEYFWDAYAPNKDSRKDILASPLLASEEQLSGLPSTFLLTDENDVLRDEGEQYGDKLMQAGNKIISVRYNGTHHDFMMLDALADTCPAKAAVRQTIEMIKQAIYE